MRDGIKRGTVVTLRVPDSPLDGTEAQVDHVEEWGAHCYAPAAATKRYRAAWDEMEVKGGEPSANGYHRREARDSGFDADANAAGYDGGVCMKCGGSHLRRTGACLTCEDCGEGGCS